MSQDRTAASDPRPSVGNPRLPSAFGRLLPIVVFLAFLALYSATLRPDVLPADSGELQLVAATGGVAHPPGFPLYTTLGWLFARLPGGPPNPAWRVNLFSAVVAAATTALVFQTGRRLTGSAWGGLAAALTLGCATSFWATATTASIRPLTAFFTALSLYALIAHGQERASTAATSQSADDRHLILFALALSLGLGHHPSLIFPASAFILHLVLVDPELLRQPHRWLRPAAASALGLLVLLYLPLRGGPDLATLPGFLQHVLALGFRGDMFALNLFDRLAILPTLLRFQFNWGLLLAALLGALLLLLPRLRCDRKPALLLFLLLVGSFLVHTAATLTYDAPQTVEYEIPAYVSLALLAAIPFKGISNSEPQTERKRIGRPALFLVHRAALVAILVAGLVNLAAHWPSYRALSRSLDIRSYAETLLRRAPDDAIILSNWHWATPMWYLQQIEGLRPDVTVRYVAPRGEPLAQTWVSEIEEHAPRRPVIVTRYFEYEYGNLPYRFEPLGQAFLVRATPNVTPPPGLSPLDVRLGDRVALLGYRLEADETEPARPLVLTLAWSPGVTPATDLALFAHLLGPDGELWSAARDSRHRAGRLVAGEVIVERFVVHPLLHAPPGDYTLVVGAYLPGEPGAPRLKTPEGTDAVELAPIHLRPSTVQPVTRHPTLICFTGGPTLLGVDYDAGPSAPMRVYLHWAGPGSGAILRLLGEDGALLGQAPVPALERGQYATTALDPPVAPVRVALLDGDRPRRWNLAFGGPAPLPAPAAPVANERYVPLGDAMVLVGFDGPRGNLEPGSEVALGLRFLGARALEQDYIVSTALTGLNPDGSWAWRDSHDTVPVQGAIPTFKWIRGSAVFDPHRLAVPEDAPSLPAAASLTVYDHFTQSPLPPLSERLGPIVPLGEWPVAGP